MILNKDQRRLYAERATELANLSAVGLVLGQFLSDRGVSIKITIIGLVPFIFGYLISYLLLRGR